MNDKVNGLILSLTDYKEADALMQVSTKEYGIISFVSRAAKKINSKNHFLPMCNYELMFDYKENKTIFNVQGHKLLNNYFEDSNIEMMTFKNILIEACLKNKDINCYDQLLFVFDHINKENKYLLGSLFFSYLIKEFGVMPIVDSCALCGDKKVVSISNIHGGFLCLKHSDGLSLIPVDNLKKFRMIIKANFDNYDLIKDFKYDYLDFKYVVSFFLDNSDLKLKAYDFYKTLV